MRSAHVTAVEDWSRNRVGTLSSKVSHLQGGPVLTNGATYDFDWKQNEPDHKANNCEDSKKGHGHYD